MSFTIAVLAALVATAAHHAPDLSRQSKSPGPALTLDQIEKLIGASVPDAVIANEVTARGVRGEISRATIDRLRAKGAGPQTIAALAVLLPRANLVIRTTPGADISLGGRSAGTASAEGEFIASDLEPERLQLQIRKAHHVARVYEVELRGRETTTLELPLDWAVGFLTLHTTPPRAQIAIDGAGNYRGAVESLPLPPRSYRVSISAPQHEPVILEIKVVAGETCSRDVVLSFDRARLSAMKTGMNTAFENGEYARAVSIAREMEQFGVLDSEGLSLAATSSYELGQYPAFLDMSRKAMRQHAKIHVAVIHHHRLLVPSHAAVLVVSTGSVEFVPRELCTVKPFKVPADRIRVGSRTILAIDDSKYLGLGFEYPSLKNPTKTDLVFFIMRSKAQRQALAELLAEAAGVAAPGT